jgi:hypothetical protein
MPNNASVHLLNLTPIKAIGVVITAGIIIHQYRHERTRNKPATAYGRAILLQKTNKGKSATNSADSILYLSATK